ncbi:hypothetical protein VP01_2965g2, partial [Puccinia sorghi]
GINCNEVKRLLRINFSNRLLLWTHLLWITGSVFRDLYGYETLGPKREIPPEIQQKLDKYLSNNPTEYLSEMQEWLLDKHKIIQCLSNINQILWNVMNISLKKNHLVNSNQSDLKMEYLSQVGTMQPAENMVFADKLSICQPTLIQTHGRAPHAQRSNFQTAHSNSKRYFLLPGILLHGVLGMDIKEGSFKRPDFELFLEHTLVILIIDNCAIHLGGPVEEICNQHHNLFAFESPVFSSLHKQLIMTGVQLIYLPSYWPELKPIEMCFSILKYYLCCNNHCKQNLLNCLQLTCSMLQPSCHPHSTFLHM